MIISRDSISIKKSRSFSTEQHFVFFLRSTSSSILLPFSVETVHWRRLRSRGNAEIDGCSFILPRRLPRPKLAEEQRPSPGVQSGYLETWNEKVESLFLSRAEVYIYSRLSGLESSHGSTEGIVSHSLSGIFYCERMTLSKGTQMSDQLETSSSSHRRKYQRNDTQSQWGSPWRVALLFDVFVNSIDALYLRCP